jgi:hypothetical protein
MAELTKIGATHLRREAWVYVRQSTMTQVRENTESLNRQYELAQRAQHLGWSADRVRVVDDDLGCSGADANTRNFDVYLRVDNRDGRLKAGQFAKGGIVLSQQADGVLLPLSAINDRTGKPWVMVVRGGKLVRQPVALQLVSEAAGQAAVSGVAPGDTVVATALIGMKAGDAVRLPKGS